MSTALEHDVSSLPMPTREEQFAIVAEASRAPSVHNVQPARWRFMPGAVLLLEDVRRRLPDADPSGHDTLVSLGAAWEGMRIALSLRGLELDTPDTLSVVDEHAPWMRVVARGAVSFAVDRSPDALAASVQARRAWRGAFAPLGDAARTRLGVLTAACGDALLLADADSIAEVARLHDACSWEFLQRPACQRELYQWMRLTTADGRWFRDGLNAECLAMSNAEAMIARLLFKPTAFGVLCSLGIARPMLAEKTRVLTSSAALVFHRPVSESAFDVGRRFYRLWLELTDAGVVACPMSSISDSPSGSARVREMTGLPDDRRIVNVLRIGGAPHEPPRSARLPVGEVVV